MLRSGGGGPTAPVQEAGLRMRGSTGTEMRHAGLRLCRWRGLYQARTWAEIEVAAAPPFHLWAQSRRPSLPISYCKYAIPLIHPSPARSRTRLSSCPQGCRRRPFPGLESGWEGARVRVRRCAHRRDRPGGRVGRTSLRDEHSDGDGTVDAPRHLVEHVPFLRAASKLDIDVGVGNPRNSHRLFIFDPFLTSWSESNHVLSPRSFSAALIAATVSWLFRPSSSASPQSW